jgi:hypothetical protein
MKQEVEKNILIAERVPPGDQWNVVGVDEIQTSLTEALNAYYMSAKVKPEAFRLEPLKGMLYIITTEEVEVLKPKPKTFNLYGE